MDDCKVLLDIIDGAGFENRHILDKNPAEKEKWEAARRLAAAVPLLVEACEYTLDRLRHFDDAFPVAKLKLRTAIAAVREPQPTEER